MSTKTQDDQYEVEETLAEFATEHRLFESLSLQRTSHSRFVLDNISELSEKFQGLHCSQPWLAYWTLQAADLLGLTAQLERRVSGSQISTMLQQCVTHSTTGSGGRRDEEAAIGFGGGPAQEPHLAATYAAVCALVMVQQFQALQSLRHGLRQWMLSLREPSGGFRMHHGGECDVRATYCVAVVCALLGLDDDCLPEERLLTDTAALFLQECQTVEGGLTCSNVSAEAHGGYTQCGLAALLLMDRVELLDLCSMRRWLCQRQFSVEGGFSGRTNKLVDSCYSHWIGSSHVLLQVAEAKRALFVKGGASANQVLLLQHAQLLDVSMMGFPTTTATEDDQPSAIRAQTLHEDRCKVRRATTSRLLQQWTDRHLRAEMEPSSCEANDARPAEEDNMEELEDEELDGDLLFDQRKLQQYVLRYCQHPNGGLRDKPGHPNDLYHTCYALSGLSQAQNLFIQQSLTQHHQQHNRGEGETCVAEGFLPFIDAAKKQNWIPNASSGLNGVVLPSVPSTLSPAKRFLFRKKKSNTPPTATQQQQQPSVLTSVVRSTNPLLNVPPLCVRMALQFFRGGKTTL